MTYKGQPAALPQRQHRMNLITLFLVLLGVLAVAGFCLYLRNTRSKRNQAVEVKAIKTPRTQTSHSDYYDYEMTATDQYLYDRCCRYMTERKPFLVESFSLQDLANVMRTNRNYLSQSINNFSGKNFRTWVNYYRVMYSIDLFKDNMSLKISDLAELSGFHTVSSFYSNFKDVMGEPPSHWCTRLRRKNRPGKKHKQ